MSTRNHSLDVFWATAERAALVTLAAIGLAALGACDNTPLSPLRPIAANITVSANPLNTLSAIIRFTGANIDSARVVYATRADTTAATAYVKVTGDAGRVVTLGLLPNTTYTQLLEIIGPHGHVTDKLPSFSTGPLTTYVQTAHLDIEGTFGPGYTLMSPIAYTGDSVLMVIFDSKGRVRWYREFPPGTGSVESKQQPNGHFTLALGGSQGDDNLPEQYVELLPSGEVVATYSLPDSQFVDAHELLVTGTTSAPILHLFGYTDHSIDLSPLSGPVNGAGIGHQLVRETADGTSQLVWNAWDHYSVADWIEPTGVNPPNDFDHTNSLAFDPTDGNYIVSFRHMGAIDKINYQTGAIMWQLGGRLGQFQILKDPLGLFSGQHSVRALDNGHIIMYDNGLRHTPPHTRAVEYALDLNKMTATMVWQYEPKPMIFTNAVGSVQRLASGNTLVGFGLAGQVHEVDANGTAVGKAAFSLRNRSTFYRAVRIVSLYQYVKP